MALSQWHLPHCRSSQRCVRIQLHLYFSASLSYSSISVLPSDCFDLYDGLRSLKPSINQFVCVQGGETYFVKIDLALKVKPGDAIVFWNLKRDGEVDPDTYHSALPPTKGEKWVGVKWIHERRYQMNAGPPVQKQKKIELVNKPVSVAS